MKRMTIGAVLLMAFTCFSQVSEVMAQAQTPQVRLVWEKKYQGEGVGHFALDVAANKPVAVIGYAGSARMIDETGKEVTLPNMQGFGQVHLSPKGRYAIGRRRGPGISGFMTLGRNGRNGGFYHDDDPYLNPASLLITEDGERMAAVRGGRHGQGDHTWAAPDDTVLLFNQRGQIVATIPAPFWRSMIFSEKDHRLYLVQQPDDAQRGYLESVLKCYDQNGHLLWQEGSSVKPWAPDHTGHLAVDTLGQLCHVVWSPQYADREVVFYDLNGKRVSEIKLPHPADSSRSDYVYFTRSPWLEVSPDGRRAIYGDYGGWFYMLDRDSAKIIWTFHNEKGSVGSQAMLDDGLIVISGDEAAGTGRKDTEHIYLLDASGNIIWRSDEGVTTTDLKGSGRWFLANLGWGTFRLFEVVK